MKNKDAALTSPAQLSPENSAPGDAGKKETPEQTIARLEAEVVNLREYKETRIRQDTETTADEIVIAEKMRVGLTRQQAINVIARQRAHDKALEELWASRRLAILDILKNFNCLTGIISREARHEVRELDSSIVKDEIQSAQKWYAEQEAQAEAEAA